MTTFINFTPSASQNTQFQAVFDGSTYNVIITWNYWGQRYYVNIYTVTGTLVLCIPLVGSPPNYNLSLTEGYFTTQLVYRMQNSQFEVI